MKKPAEVAPRMTAREVLARSAPAHAAHSIVKKSPLLTATRKSREWCVQVWCSCGQQLLVPATEENMAGLRNVREVV